MLRLGYNDILSRNTWLISEKRTEARDNGYYIFKYLRQSESKNEAYYSIVSSGIDYQKINNLGNVVEYNSLPHIALYLGSKYLLYCQVDNKPYENVRGIAKLDSFRRNKQIRVYLTHGICKDNIPTSYNYRLAKYNIFICGARPEYDYYKKLYKYPEKNIALTGLCRFDGLFDTSSNNIILVMPTFRNWLRTDNSSKEKATDKECELMLNSDFYNCYASLLLNARLQNILKENNVRVVFYLHYTLQPYTHLFKDIVNSDRIEVCEREQYDVQDLLKKAKILITDYSSVAFDFSYMRKPVAYYHFDYKKYRSEHYKEGFFNYIKHGVGPIINNEDDLVIWINNTILTGYLLSDKYSYRLNDFFVSYDKENCERVYQTVANYEL